MSNKSRGYCFTINNWTAWDVADIERLRDTCEYYVFGREVGECGTPHLQGFVRFKNPVSFTTIKTALPRAHIEKQRGDGPSAAAYCKKDGDYEEFGILAAEKRSTADRWRFIIDCAERGDLDSIKSEYPGDYLRLFDKLHRIRQRTRRIIDGPLEHEWWYGPTGTGKSRKVWEDYPDHFAKQLNKWWDGYDDEDVVVIEEWAPRNECTASALKIWADRYPFPAEVKGGTLRRIRPRKIIVTSNYTIDQCFERAEDREPIKRRFKQVHFPRTPWMDMLFNSQEEKEQE